MEQKSPFFSTRPPRRRFFKRALTTTCVTLSDTLRLNRVAPRRDPAKIENRSCANGTKIFNRSKRASRVPLGKRALGNCWAKGPAVVGIRGTLGRGALWASGVLGGWANGAFGGCSAAIPNGKPFRVDVISIETRFGPSRFLPDVSKQYLLGSLGSDMIQNCIQP